MAKQNMTIYQRLNKVFGPEGVRIPKNQTNRYSIDNNVLLKTDNKKEFETAKLQAQQGKYLTQQWRRVDNELFQQSIHYETTRIGAYADFEAMEFYPEIAAALDIMMEECLAGDTIIPLLDGSETTILDLYNKNTNNFWVYSVDIKLNTVKPSKIDRVIKKGVKNVYKITLDDGSEFKSTNDHKWLNFNGEWIETEKLVKGDSLKSISRKLNHKGYEQVSLTNFKGDTKFTHILVAEDTLKNEKDILLSDKRSQEEKIVVHHKSFDKLNNNPNELEYMFWNDHQKLHSDLNSKRWEDNNFSNKMKKIFSISAKRTWESLSNLEKKDKINNLQVGLINKLKGLNQNEKSKLLNRFGKNNGMYKSNRFGILNPNYDKNKNHVDDIDELNYLDFISSIKGDRRTKAMERFNLNKFTVIKYHKYLCEKYNLNRIEDIDFIYNNGYDINKIKSFISEETSPNKKLKKYAESHGLNLYQINRYLKTVGYKNWSDCVETIGNHRVVSVEYVGEEPVFDLLNSSVDENFAVKCNTGMIISHNCTTVNANGRILNVYSDSTRIKTILEDLFFNRLDIHLSLPMWTRNTCKYGDNFLFLNIDDRAGVLGARQLPNFDIERKEGSIIDNIIGGRNLATGQGSEKEPGIKFYYRGRDIVFNSWQIAHFRLLSDDRRLPYGSSVLEKARRVWKQLQLSEDAMLVYRVTRAPERRVYKIYVGNIDDADVPAYVEMIANRFKRSQVVDPQTGQVDLRYNTLANDQDFFIPVRDENAPNPIDTLPGACLALNTRIPLLDGRTLELNEIIKEWDAGNRDLWAYSCNPNTGELAPGMITWAGITRENAQVMKITLDNGNTVITTPDHKFVHRTNGFVEAQYLVVGDSLMPFYRDTAKIKSNTNGDYERVWDSHKQEWIFTHRMVTDSLSGSNVIQEFVHDNKYINYNKKVRHHKDHNRFNNNPSNIVWMNGADHMKYHQSVIMETIWSDPEQNIEKIRDGINNYISNLSNEEKELRAEQSRQNSINSRNKANKTFDLNPDKTKILKIRGEAISKVKSTNEFKEKFSKIASDNWKSDEYRNKVFSKKQTLTFTDELYNMFFEMFKQYGKADLTLVELNNSDDFMNEFRSVNTDVRSSITNLDEFTHNHLKKMLKERGFTNYQEWCKSMALELGYKNVRAWRYYIEKESKMALYNHKIIDIEWLEETMDTGTLTIDGEEKLQSYHTFALESGVYVKNSNLDQIADIQYLQRKLVTALRVPKTFLGFEEPTGEGKNLSLQDIRFSRTINRIQQAMLAELNKIAIIHLYILGFDEELNNFSLSLNNPSTQQEMLHVEHTAAKIGAYIDATTPQPNGFAPMSMTRGKRELLGWSNDEIRQDLLEQRIEKAAAAELENTSSVIKNTKLFDKVDKLYGDIDKAREGGGPAEGEEGIAGGGGGGGGGSGGFGGGFDGGEVTDVEDFEDQSSDIDTEEEPSVDTTVEEPMEGLGRDRNVITEEIRGIPNNKKNKFFDGLINSMSDKSINGGETMNKHVEYIDKNLKINETINDIINDIDRMVNE